MIRCWPTTPCTLFGAVKGVPSRVSERSDRGVVDRVIVLRFGKMLTLRVVVSSPAEPSGAPESVTLRSTWYQVVAEVSPMFAVVNDPAVVPVIGPRYGWVCVSWWKTTIQEKAPAPSVPSSGSDAVAEKLTVSPALNIDEAAGERMVAAGDRLPATTRVCSVEITCVSLTSSSAV